MSTETEADTSTLEALDFEVRCEAWGHADDHAAKWVRRGTCPACHVKSLCFVCDDSRASTVRQVAAGEKTKHLGQCDAVTLTADWHYTFTPLPGVTS